MALADLMSDTHPDVVDALVARWRSMTPGEKFGAAIEMSELVAALSEAGVRARYPDASDDEIRFRVLARRIDRDTLIQAYGEPALVAFT